MTDVEFDSQETAWSFEDSFTSQRVYWSCAALSSENSAFHISPTRPDEADTCGYCGDEFSRTGLANANGLMTSPLDWEHRLYHRSIIHNYRECNQAEKFYSEDHFLQHLVHRHAGTNGKWTIMLTNACMKDEPLPQTSDSQITMESEPGLSLSAWPNTVSESNENNFLLLCPHPSCTAGPFPRLGDYSKHKAIDHVDSVQQSMEWNGVTTTVGALLQDYLKLTQEANGGEVSVDSNYYEELFQRKHTMEQQLDMAEAFLNFTLRDGSLKWAICSMKAVVAGDVNYVGIVGVMEDLLFVARKTLAKDIKKYPPDLRWIHTMVVVCNFGPDVPDWTTVHTLLTESRESYIFTRDFMDHARKFMLETYLNNCEWWYLWPDIELPPSLVDVIKLSNDIQVSLSMRSLLLLASAVKGFGTRKTQRSNPLKNIEGSISTAARAVTPLSSEILSPSGPSTLALDIPKGLEDHPITLAQESEDIYPYKCGFVSCPLPGFSDRGSLMSHLNNFHGT
jgi:hypothetical protein